MRFMDVFRRIVQTRDEKGRPTSDWFRLTARKRMRTLTGKSPGRILDAGGGEGLLFHKEVSSLTKDTVILDFEKESLKTFRENSNYGETVLGDITDMPFPERSFDTSVCVGTFYNFPDAESVRRGLIEMSRVTKKGGRVIVEFRNRENPFVRLAVRYARSYDPSLRDLPLVPYTMDEIKDMLSNAGLEIKRMLTVGFPSSKLAFSYIIEAQHIQEDSKD